MPRKKPLVFPEDAFTICKFSKVRRLAQIT